MGFDVLLVGRKKHDSLRMSKRAYETYRLMLLFEKGPLFYMEYNLRLFFFLLINPHDLLVSNDLDTLLPNFLMHKLKGKPLVYDSHEYFLGVPELEGRPFVRGIWKRIESHIFPKLKHIFTVNQSIAGLYKKDYGKELRVVRNMPERMTPPVPDKAALGLPEDRPILILQGAGINIDRGAEEAVLAMQYLEHALLLIIGSGDAIPGLKVLVAEHQLETKVMFIPRQPLAALLQYTVCADIGLTLDKDTNLNYRYSLPNKIFDYIQAGVPVLASDLPEIRKVIDEYKLGLITPSHDPQIIAVRMKEMLADPERIAMWKENLIIAARNLCWENEVHALQEVYGQYL